LVEPPPSFGRRVRALKLLRAHRQTRVRVRDDIRQHELVCVFPAAGRMLEAGDGDRDTSGVSERRAQDPRDHD
jgi:hypothetical protein